MLKPRVLDWGYHPPGIPQFNLDVLRENFRKTARMTASDPKRTFAAAQISQILPCICIASSASTGTLRFRVKQRQRQVAGYLNTGECCPWCCTALGDLSRLMTK